MAQQLPIVGFKNYASYPTAIPLNILVASEHGGFRVLFPDGDTKEMPHATLEKLKEVAFVPCQGEMTWEDGQMAYLDWNGKIHVKKWEEISLLIKADLSNISDKKHQALLDDMLKVEGERHRTST